MVNSKDVKEILQTPLGPYRDSDILHETCEMKDTTVLVLYSFVLAHNGQVIGLDESEHPLGEGEHDDRKFYFRGVLKIANPDWLSEFGLKIVETELKLRARERALREGERMRMPHLTLEGLFSERGLLTRSNDSTWRKEDETKLMIRIQGEKNMPAVYMNASRVPNGLLWSSKAHNRKYQIATMDVETYSRSRNFFWQWRLLALMEKICKRYPYIPESKRTPGWFVEKYIADFSCPPEDRHRRIIFDEDDTDVDETGKTVTPRHLLRPHASEIFGLFAAHAGWLINNNEVKRKKLFDIKPWRKFIRDARKQRKEAARQGVMWGYPEGEGIEEAPSDESSEDELPDDELARENPVIGKNASTVARKLELGRARPAHRTKPSISSGSESDWDGAGRAQYASDFSEPSDVEENDSDHWLAEEEAVNQIPWQLRLPPLLPDVDGRWWCPLQECNYQIDLHDLTKEEERGIPEELVGYVLERQWGNAAYDDKVLQGFRHLVTNHYMKHFEERGVKAERREGKTRFTFINGRRRLHGAEEPIRGPMPLRGTLGGESRVVPIVHAVQAVDHV